MSHFYLLGLFEGDGYQWTGTFGITNRDVKILQKAESLLKEFGEVRWRRDNKGFYRVCIVGRPAKRYFLHKMQEVKTKLTDEKSIGEYFAGKYDADGSRWKTLNRLKITYSFNDDVAFDQKLLLQLGIESKLRKYKNRNAFDLEISSMNASKFFQATKEFSLKMFS